MEIAILVYQEQPFLAEKRYDEGCSLFNGCDYFTWKKSISGY